MGDKPIKQNTDPFLFKADLGTPLVPPEHDDIPSSTRGGYRDECALLIDHYIRRIVALKDKLDPALAAGLARFRDARLHQRLGFLRMKDFVVECLELDWRKARYLLQVHDVFRGLPLLADAFRNGRLPWTKARLIAGVADDDSQAGWLHLAGELSVRALEKQVRVYRESNRLPWEVGNANDGSSDEIPEPGDEADEGQTTRPITQTRGSGLENGGVEDEPWITFRYRVPAHVRWKWEQAVIACRRQGSQEMPLGECAEYFAAEALGLLDSPDCGKQGNLESLDSAMCIPSTEAQETTNTTSQLPPAPDFTHSSLTWNPLDYNDEINPGHRDEKLAMIEKDYNNWDFLAWIPVTIELVGQLERDLSDLDAETSIPGCSADAQRLHAAILRIIRFREYVDRHLGRLLSFFGNQRFHELCRFLSLRHYMRERLGMSPRQAEYLIQNERTLIDYPELESAYLEGRIGSAKVRVLSRVIDDVNADSWIEHAQSVTVRRLEDEVRWVEDVIDRDRMGLSSRITQPPGPGEGPYGLVKSGVDHDAQSGLTTIGLQTCSRAEVFENDTLMEPRELDKISSVIRFGAPAGSAAVWERALALALKTAVSRRGIDPHGHENEYKHQDHSGKSEFDSSMPDTSPSWSDKTPPHASPPTWACIELILDIFLDEWGPANEPDQEKFGYPRSVFERDGWRCMVPGCHKTTNLTPHHIIRRSQGGGDELTNLVTVCWKHHLDGIHGGIIHVQGEAPENLIWELGRRDKPEPILIATNDRILLGPRNPLNSGMDQSVGPAVDLKAHPEHANAANADFLSEEVFEQLAPIA